MQQPRVVVWQAHELTGDDGYERLINLIGEFHMPTPLLVISFNEDEVYLPTADCYKQMQKELEAKWFVCTEAQRPALVQYLERNLRPASNTIGLRELPRPLYEECGSMCDTLRFALHVCRQAELSDEEIEIAIDHLCLGMEITMLTTEFEAGYTPNTITAYALLDTVKAGAVDDFEFERSVLSRLYPKASDGYYFISILEMGPWRPNGGPVCWT